MKMCVCRGGGSTHPSALLLLCPPSLRYIEKSITPTCSRNENNRRHDKKRRRPLLIWAFNALSSSWEWLEKQKSKYLRVQVLPLHTQVGVDDVQPDEQPCDDGSLLFHHQRVGLIEFAEGTKAAPLIGSLPWNRVYYGEAETKDAPEQVFSVDDGLHVV